MASVGDKTSIVAIVIAWIAFFVTFAQFLLQAFGTIGVGRRRCQPSVMGQWAKTRRYRWIWAEFRFETTYLTPNFHLHSTAPVSNDRGSFLITGGEFLRVKIFQVGQHSKGRVEQSTEC